MKKLVVLLALALCAGRLSAASPVIPAPLNYEERTGAMNLSAVKVKYPAALAAEGRYLEAKLREVATQASPMPPATGRTVTVGLKIDRKAGAPGSYKLNVTPRRAEIIGADTEGVFHGAVTLLQMASAGKGLVQCAAVSDAPRFAWRGFMLDEARHFSSEQKVMQILDLMAWYKLNRFHWHLTDSEGWRIEIKSYPRLTTVGSKGSWSRPESTEPQFYTQEQIRRIVAYAAERHIEVIPEIDMPGHATAANRAYPELSGGEGKQNPHFTFNPGKEVTYTMLGKVLREVAALFPSQYIHIGGDEVSFGIDAWDTDPDVQALIKREKLASPKQAEDYFVRRIADTVRSIGKVPVGWEEILSSKPEKNTVIMWWRQNKPEELFRSLSEGYTTILCPRVPCYLDFLQDPTHKWGRLWVKAYCPLESVYAFPDSTLDELAVPDSLRRHITGIQANLWRERIHELRRLDYMMWPRLCALAESGWSAPSVKNFADFSRRMDYAYDLLDRLGIYYYDHRDPSHHPEAPGREKNETEEGKPAVFID